jgi:hypothetical protein
VVSFTTVRALPPGEGPYVPVGQEARWPPESVWTQRIEENSFASARDRTPFARLSSPCPGVGFSSVQVIIPETVFNS